MRSDFGDGADRLVAEADPGPGRRVVEEVKIGSADGRPLYGDDGAFWSRQLGIGNVLDHNLSRTQQNRRSHDPHATAALHCTGPKIGSIPMPQTLDFPQTLEGPVLADEDIDAFYDFEDLWAVIVWNDDVTTFQTVIKAFVEIFGHTVERADELAWRIHRTGKAAVAVRPKDEAEAAVHALHLRKISATIARA